MSRNLSAKAKDVALAADGRVSHADVMRALAGGPPLVLSMRDWRDCADVVERMAYIGVGSNVRYKSKAWRVRLVL